MERYSLEQAGEMFDIAEKIQPAAMNDMTSLLQVSNTTNSYSSLLIPHLLINHSFPVCLFLNSFSFIHSDIHHIKITFISYHVFLVSILCLLSLKVHLYSIFVFFFCMNQKQLLKECVAPSNGVDHTSSVRHMFLSLPSSELF